MIDWLRRIGARLGRYADRGADALYYTVVIHILRCSLIVLMSLAVLPVFVPLVILGYVVEKVAGPKKGNHGL